MEGKGTNHNTPLLFLAWLLISIILFFIVRRVYFKWIHKGKKENEKFTEETNEWLKKRHDEHVKAGIEYHKHCEVCRGLL